MRLTYPDTGKLTPLGWVFFPSLPILLPLLFLASHDKSRPDYPDYVQQADEPCAQEIEHMEFGAYELKWDSGEPRWRSVYKIARKDGVTSIVFLRSNFVTSTNKQTGRQQSTRWICKFDAEANKVLEVYIEHNG
jgi:hypothetical protein